MIEAAAKPRSGTDKRLQRACEHVSDLWFPANPDLLKRIRLSLSESKYGDTDAFLVDLKADFSLFTFCLKELSRMVAAEGGNPDDFRSPRDLLQWAGLERLRKLLNSDNSKISGHNFSSISEVQLERIGEAIAVAGTAELIAEHKGLDDTLGYSAALLRQLGYTLIAWNYPTIYQRAVASLHDGSRLDIAIAQLLGFSPTMLAMRVVQSWGLSPALLSVFDEYQLAAEVDLEDAAELRALGATLSKICEVGEALARANNPELYPTATADWDVAKKEIEKELGNEGMALIQERFQEQCRTYFESVPHLFRGGMILDPAMKLREHHRREIFSSNPYIARCTPHIELALEDLYSKFSREEIYRENVSTLVKHIIPQAQFTGGCIFTIDPSTTTLLPQTLIGRLRGRPAAAVSYSIYSNGSDPIGDTFRLKQEVIDEKETELGTMVCLSGVLGYSQRIGVLYLEMPKSVWVTDEEQHLINFKAMAQALNDCLNLR